MVLNQSKNIDRDLYRLRKDVLDLVKYLANFETNPMQPRISNWTLNVILSMSPSFHLTTFNASNRIDHNLALYRLSTIINNLIQSISFQILII